MRRKEIAIGAPEGVGSGGVSPAVEIFLDFNFKHSKTRSPLSSGFIFIFLFKPFSVKIVDRYNTIIVS